MKPLALPAFLALLTLCHPAGAQSSPPWNEGKDYFLVTPAQPTSLPPGKVEVTEVFSYGCPYCNLYLPVMKRLKQTLPATAVIDFLPASFNPAEDWPMFQRAYLTA